MTNINDLAVEGALINVLLTSVLYMDTQLIHHDEIMLPTSTKNNLHHRKLKRNEYTTHYVKCLPKH